MTGAFGTIGSEITAGLSRARLDVIVACRTGHETMCLENVARLASSSQNVYVESVDFGSMNSTNIFLQRIATKYGNCLRVIVNSVGVFPPSGFSRDGINLNFQVNVLSYFLTMTRLSPYLQMNAPSSVVNMASAAAYYFNSSEPLDLDVNRVWTYAETKAADIMLTMEAARRFRHLGIFVNAVHPGDTSSSTFITNPSADSIGLREQQCCALNELINRVEHQNNLAVISSCCDSPSAAADRPIWLALNAARKDLNGTWWAKVYHMPSIFEDHFANMRLWTVCNELSKKLLTG